MRKVLFLFLCICLPTLLSAQPEHIPFQTDAVKGLCVANWDTDSDGELSYDEAAAVTTLGRVFKGRSDINGSFHELRYFTGLKSISDSAFFDCHWLKAITLPQSIEVIGAKAFWSCIRVDTLCIPQSVKSLEKACFFHCEVLKEINVPGAVDSIPVGAFMWCSRAHTATINEGTRYICSKAFAHCERLEYLTLPSTIKSIGSEAITSITELRHLTIHAVVPPEAAENAFSDRVLNFTVLYVPEGSREAYQNSPVWGRFKFISELF